jgi:hypothetical protein
VDEGEYAKTTVSLRSARRNMYRAKRAAAKQINAVPDPDAEEGATRGPDSVIAVLNMDSDVVTSILRARAPTMRMAWLTPLTATPTRCPTSPMH